LQSFLGEVRKGDISLALKIIEPLIKTLDDEITSQKEDKNSVYKYFNNALEEKILKLKYSTPKEIKHLKEDFVSAYSLYGKLLIKIDEFHKAKDALNKAYDLNPVNVDVILAMCEFYKVLMMKDLESSLEKNNEKFLLYKNELKKFCFKGLDFCYSKQKIAAFYRFLAWSLYEDKIYETAYTLLYYSQEFDPDDKSMETIYQELYYRVPQLFKDNDQKTLENCFEKYNSVLLGGSQLVVAAINLLCQEALEANNIEFAQSLMQRRYNLTGEIELSEEEINIDGFIKRNIDTIIESTIYKFSLGSFNDAINLIEPLIKKIEKLNKYRDISTTRYLKFKNILEERIYHTIFRPVKKIINIPEDYPTAYRYFAKILIEFKEIDRAKDCLEKALVFNPINADILLDINNFNLSQKENQEKQIILSNIIPQEVDPNILCLKSASNSKDIAQAYQNLANIFKALDKNILVIVLLSQCLLYDPENNDVEMELQLLKHTYKKEIDASGNINTIYWLNQNQIPICPEQYLICNAFSLYRKAQEKKDFELEEIYKDILWDNVRYDSELNTTFRALPLLGVGNDVLYFSARTNVKIDKIDTDTIIGLFRYKNISISKYNSIMSIFIELIVVAQKRGDMDTYKKYINIYEEIMQIIDMARF